MSNLHFRFMSFGFKFRDIFLRPKNFLKKVGVGPDLSMLDYGCGPGSFAIAAAELVGENGRVYALDIHPLAIQRVQKVATKKGLRNVQTIRSSCETELPADSIDIVLLYDTLHELHNPNGIFQELYRVLKPRGILSVADHHMKGDEIVSKVTHGGLFRLDKKGTQGDKKRYHFLKPS